jgi:hypothetical protein
MFVDAAMARARRAGSPAAEITLLAQRLVSRISR